MPRPPTLRYPTKDVVWGGVPGFVNYAKFHQNQLRGFGSLRGQSLLFSYMQCCIWQKYVIQDGEHKCV